MAVLSKVSTVKSKRNLKALKVVLIFVGILFSLLLLASLLSIKPLTGLVASAKTLKDESRLLKDAAITQDLDKTRESLLKINSTMLLMQKDLSSLGWVRVVPIAGSYYSDAVHGMSAALAGTSAGVKSIDAIYPFAPKIGFKTANSEAFGSMKEKAAELLMALPQIAPSLGGIQADVSTMNKELALVNPNRYPDMEVKGLNLKKTVAMLKEVASVADSSFPDIQKAAVVLPPAFGSGGQTKTYALIFANDKELRPTGGFWTAYALATFKNGQLVDIKSNDIYNLDQQIGNVNHPPAPALFKGFLDVDYFYARDANISPDFVVSGQKFLEFWRQAGMPQLAGVWQMDTYVLKELLRDLGPVSVSGYDEPFSEDNVIERLETYTNILLREQAGRKNVIGELMNALMQKTFSASQKEYPSIISSGIKLLQQKHILISFSDSSAQSLAEEYNVAGRIKAFSGDYLHVNDANLGGRKANWFVTQQISKEVSNQNGQVVSKVTITYQNPGAYHPDFNTGYKDLVRVYVPEGSKLLSSSGSLTPVSTTSDLDKTVFTAAILVKPDGGTATLTFDYTLPASVVSSGQYSLLLQKQPGTEGIPVDLKINGRSQKLTLDTDKVINQKI